MGIVDDLKSELQSARAERQWYEADWQEYVTYTAPDMERGFNRPGGVTAPDGMSALRHSAARERSRKLYDPTAVWLLDRLASGVGSLTMPEGFAWHGVGFGDPFAPPPSQIDEEFFELVRDHLFRVRYSARSGFALANRSRLLSTVKLGTGVLFPIENEDNLADIRTPVQYRYVPLYEIYLIVDAQGNDCGFFRVRMLKAWQAVKEYGGNVSEKVKEEAGDPKRKNTEHAFVHACFLREGGHAQAGDVRKSRYESLHFEEESKHICRRGGFFEYPLVISRWDRDGLSPYGSPTAANRISYQAINRARLTMGENLDDLRVIAMHSFVYGTLLDDEKIEFKKPSEAPFEVPYYAGMMVVHSEMMPVTAGANSDEYSCFLFAPGAFMHFDEVPNRQTIYGNEGTEITRDPDIGDGGGADYLTTRRFELIHPAGMDFLASSLAKSQGASLAELRNAANWDRKYTRKNVKFACLKVNI